jgi:hypothetical protein
MLELNGKPSSVTMLSTDFSFQNLVFKKLFEFSVTKITENSMLDIQVLPCPQLTFPSNTWFF